MSNFITDIFDSMIDSIRYSMMTLDQKINFMSSKVDILTEELHSLNNDMRHAYTQYEKQNIISKKEKIIKKLAKKRDLLASLIKQQRAEIREEKEIEQEEAQRRQQENELAAQQAKEQERQRYENDDMRNIKQIIATIPLKIQDIDNFNSLLNKSMNMYASKALRTMEFAYGNNVPQGELSFSKDGDSYNYIKEKYSQKINQTVALACDATISKIRSVIAQKQELVRSNKIAKAQYNQLMQKLQKQYEDELALQRIKEINKDINDQMDKSTDYEQQELKNIEIQRIIENINQIDREVNARREYEIQFGQLEI